MSILFGIFAVSAILGALGVLFSKHPIRGALWLLLNFVSIGLLYLIAKAPFVGIVQILIYAGSIVLVILFVIIIMNLRTPTEDHDTGIKGFLAFILGITAMLISVILFLKSPLPKLSIEVAGSPENIASYLFTDYLIPFELPSVILLVAIVGAIVLIRKRRRHVT